MNSIKKFLSAIRMRNIANKIIRYKNLKTIPLNLVRCQNKPFSVKQGFSNKPIEFFPPAQFFCLYLTNKEDAIDKFEKWLYEWLIEKQAWKEPQINGGWENGSLVTAISKAHKDQNILLNSFYDVNLDIVRDVIKTKTTYYFTVLESIKKNGFDKYHHQSICCRKEGDFYILTNGHHRTSSLYALGYKEIPMTVLK